MTTLIAREVTKIAAPVITVVALSFFFQGHNLPGGGFIAGVMTAASTALVCIVFDFEEFSKLLGLKNCKYRTVGRYVSTSSTGLLVATGSGLLSVSLGSSFLGHRFGVFQIPLIGKMHWTTAMIFDLGVYLTVFSSILLVVEVLAEE